MVDEIKEIRIKKVENLSPSAQREVEEKLKEVSENFNYRGYAKVSYKENSPLSVVSIDPIEGTIIDVFSGIMNKIKKEE